MKKIDYSQQSTQKGIVELTTGVVIAVLGIAYGVQLDGEQAAKINQAASALAALIPVIIGIGQSIVGAHNIRRDENAEKQ